MTEHPSIEVGLLSRCQQRMYRRSLSMKRLSLALDAALELEDIYWEQVRKLSPGEVKTAFEKHAKDRTKDRKRIEKALRSRGVAI